MVGGVGGWRAGGRGVAANLYCLRPEAELQTTRGAVIPQEPTRGRLLNSVVLGMVDRPRGPWNRSIGCLVSVA